MLVWKINFDFMFTLVSTLIAQFDCKIKHNKPNVEMALGIACETLRHWRLSLGEVQCGIDRTLPTTQPDVDEK